MERVMELRVVRPTDRFDAAVQFYTDTLGWPVARSWSEGGRGCLIDAGGTARIELLECDPDAVVAAQGVSVSVEVPSAAAVDARLRAAGVAPTLPLGDRPWGHRSVGCTDPTGLAVVLFEVV